MIANYHTHTARCRHAVGEDAQYAEAAFEAGLQILGFSDHTPYWFEGDYYSYMRMFREELSDYADSVRALQAQYAGKMQIHLGVEMEYYPAFFPETLKHLQEAGVEYMILGQHWSGNEIDEPYNGRPTEDETLLARYCDQVIEAMSTGLFTYLAHPDLHHFVGEEAVYRKHMQRLCEAAARYQLPLEINLLGMSTHRHYPNPLFWQLAAEAGCCAVLGRDAHDPVQFFNKDVINEAKALAASVGLPLKEVLELRSI